MFTPTPILSRLIEAVCSDALAAEEIRELEELLKGDAEACRYYLNYCWMHAGLRDAVSLNRAMDAVVQKLDDGSAIPPAGSAANAPISGLPDESSRVLRGLSLLGDLSAPPGAPLPEAADSDAPRPLRPALLSLIDRIAALRTVSRAAALLIGSMCVGALVAVPATLALMKSQVQAQQVVPNVAQLTAALNVRWANGRCPLVVDQQLTEGQSIEILAGCVEITFTSGVRAVLEGPASIGLQSSQHARLNFGRLMVELSSPAAHFRVDTPTAQIVDLGAEFGVQVESAGNSEVHVLVGAVEVRYMDEQGKATRDSARLESGQAIRLSPKGDVVPMTAVAGNFTRDLGAREVPPEDPFRVMAWYRLGEDDARAQDNTNKPLSFDRAGVRHLRPYCQLITTSDTLAAGSSLATSFDGKSQILSGDVLPGRPTDNFGIEAWINPASAGGCRVIAYYGNTCNSGWGLIMYDDLVCGLLGGATFDIGRVSIPNHRWTHVALVRSNGRSTFYVDGAPAGTTSTWSGHTPSGRFMIGGESLQRNQYFHGKIDDVRVFRFPAGGFDPAEHLSFRRESN